MNQIVANIKHILPPFSFDYLGKDIDMNREELLLEAANLFEKAKKIERNINWNNDAQRDSSLKKLEQIIFDAHWKFNQARKGV